MKSLKFFLVITLLFVLYSTFNFFNLYSTDNVSDEIMLASFIQLASSILLLVFVKFVDDNFNYLNKK